MSRLNVFTPGVAQAMHFTRLALDLEFPSTYITNTHVKSQTGSIRVTTLSFHKVFKLWPCVPGLHGSGYTVVGCLLLTKSLLQYSDSETAKMDLETRQYGLPRHKTPGDLRLLVSQYVTNFVNRHAEHWTFGNHTQDAKLETQMSVWHFTALLLNVRVLEVPSVYHKYKFKPRV